MVLKNYHFKKNVVTIKPKIIACPCTLYTKKHLNIVIDPFIGFKTFTQCTSASLPDFGDCKFKEMNRKKTDPFKMPN